MPTASREGRDDVEVAISADASDDQASARRCHEGRRRFGPDGQLSRPTERRRTRGWAPGTTPGRTPVWYAGDLSVRHDLGHEVRGHRDAREHITAEPRPLVVQQHVKPREKSAPTRRLRHSARG